MIDTSQMNSTAINMSTNFTEIFSEYERSMLDKLSEEIIICMKCGHKADDGSLKCIKRCRKIQSM